MIPAAITFVGMLFAMIFIICGGLIVTALEEINHNLSDIADLMSDKGTDL